MSALPKDHPSCRQVCAILLGAQSVRKHVLQDEPTQQAMLDRIFAVWFCYRQMIGAGNVEWLPKIYRSAKGSTTCL